MKLKLKTEEFSNLLATVLPAVSIRSTLPTLSHFLIDAKDGKVSVYATDLEIGIESSISTDIEKEGSVTVPARNLTEMIKVLDSKEFTFQKVSDSQFKIFTSDGNTTFNIIGGEKEEFPVLPKIKKEKSVELKSCKIKEGIEKTISSISKDESRYVLCGIFFECKGDKFKMVSTDGRRLSFYQDKISKKIDDFSAIIPSKAINVLDRTITYSEEPVKISISTSENQIYFSFGNTVIYSRMIEGEYPSYNQVIPERSTKNIIIETQKIIDATKKMLAVTMERAGAVNYKFKSNKAVISVTDPETGSGTSTIPVQYDGEEIEIAFNPEFLINALKVVKSEKIKLGLTTSINSGKITTLSDDEDYVAVIMPMRS